MPFAARARSRPRRAITLALLALASVALHGLLITGATSDAWRMRSGRVPALTPPIEVALIPGQRDTVPAPKAAVTDSPPPRAVVPSAVPRPRPAPPQRPSSPPAAGLESAAPVVSSAPEPLAASAQPDTDAAPAEPAAVAPDDAGTPPSTTPPVSVEPPAATASSGADPLGAPGAQAPTAETVVSLPPLPASRRGRFRIFWGDYREGQSVARMSYWLEVTEDRYRIRTEGQAEGLISLVYAGTLTQSSEGRQSAAGLEPLRYVETRGKGSQRVLAFDPDAKTMLPAGGDPVAAPAGTQDRLSVFYQLGLMARAEPGLFVAGRTIAVPVATLRSVRLERFAVMGEEVLDAPGGPVRAIHLQRPPPPDTRDPLIDLWLGIDQDMLPVRLRIEDGSRRVLDQIIELTG